MNEGTRQKKKTLGSHDGVRSAPYTGRMKHLIPAMLAVAISIVPLGATAGEPQPPMPPPPPIGMFGEHLNLTPSQQQQWHQIMQQTGQQMQALHTQARAKVLGALSPAHRALLAQVVGALAIAPNPDPQAAARQLDAALSPGEAQAVVSAHTAAMQQAHQLMESAHQRFQSVLTAQQRAQFSSSHEGGPDSHEVQMRHMDQQLTAGEILLHFAGGGDDHGMVMMHPGMEHHR